jgi:hypothetical protein
MKIKLRQCIKLSNGAIVARDEEGYKLIVDPGIEATEGELRRALVERYYRIEAEREFVRCALAEIFSTSAFALATAQAEAVKGEAVENLGGASVPAQKPSKKARRK